MILKRQMAMPAWKYYLFKAIDRIKTKAFWSSFFEGLGTVLTGLSYFTIFYLLLFLFGEDELHRKKFNQKEKKDTTYYKTNNLPSNKTNFIHKNNFGR